MKAKTFSLRFTKQELDQLNQAAKKEGISPSDIIRRAIGFYITPCSAFGDFVNAMIEEIKQNTGAEIPPFALIHAALCDWVALYNHEVQHFGNPQTCPGLVYINSMGNLSLGDQLYWIIKDQYDIRAMNLEVLNPSRERPDLIHRYNDLNEQIDEKIHDLEYLRGIIHQSKENGDDQEIQVAQQNWDQEWKVFDDLQKQKRELIKIYFESPKEEENSFESKNERLQKMIDEFGLEEALKRFNWIASE